MAVARARRVAKRADPRSDPRYRRVVDKLDADSRKLKQHPPPSKKSDESNKAAKGPANEKAAGARAKQVDKLEEAETPKPQTATFLDMLRAAGEHSAEDLLSLVDVPTLVVAGDRDSFTPSEVSRAMAEAIPNSEFVLLKGGSHLGPLERREEVRLAIFDFLDRRVGLASMKDAR